MKTKIIISIFFFSILLTGEQNLFALNYHDLAFADTSGIIKLIDRGEAFLISKPDTARLIALEAFQLSKKLNFAKGKIKAGSLYTEASIRLKPLANSNQNDTQFLFTILSGVIFLIIFLIYMVLRIRKDSITLDIKHNVPIEYRLMRIAPLIVIVLIIFSAVVNYFLGLYQVIIISLLFLVLFVYFYWAARNDKIGNKSLFVFNLATLAVLDLNWFYNGGSQSPILILLFLHAMLTVLINKKFQLIWLIACIINATLLIVLEFYWPQTILVPYLSRSQRYSDISFAPLILMPVFFWFIRYVKVNYDLERNKVIEQNTAIQEQTAKLSELNKLKDRFFSIIAHDLRNPMAVVKLVSDILVLRNDHLDAEARLKYYRKLDTTIRNSSDLLDNLLNWSRMQMNSVQLEIRRNDLFLTINNAAAQLHDAASAKDIKIIQEINGEEFAWYDENSIVTVLRNLLANAIKFSYRASVVKIGINHPDEDCVSVYISDNGVGIKTEEIKLLFQLDQKVSNHGTENESGTGLGLILAKEFVEKNYGKISVESIPGHGSTFSFTLPTRQIK
jgi:signal transduction histidine kinase